MSHVDGLEDRIRRMAAEMTVQGGGRYCLPLTQCNGAKKWSFNVLIR